MISCDEAAVFCNKKQYREATLIEKIKLRIHLLFCSACAVFSKKNAQFTILCEKSQIQSLSEEDKIRIKKQLQKKL